MDPARRVPARATPIGGTREEFAGAIVGRLLALRLELAPAVHLASLVAIETGYGHSTYRFNVGFILADGWPGLWFDGAEIGVPGFVYRAYASLDEALADLVHVLNLSRYARARALLLAGDRRWYTEAVRAGYTGGDASTADHAYGNVPDLVGAAWQRYATRELGRAPRVAEASGGGIFVGLALTAAAALVYRAARR